MAAKTSNPPKKPAAPPSAPASGTAPPVAPHQTNDEAVRSLAYQKWEAAGKPEGNCERFWLEAERELNQK